jgi:2-polyprenyl-3-methyl-5-hydroxy-6-metoxy-1,4-benzoquinol methylase
MMFLNLEKRKEHWSTGWTAKNQGDSDPCPFQDYLQFFTFRDVLEIGAGEGRQYQYAKIGTKSYAIADISVQALNTDKIPLDVDRFHIESYDDNFEERFDFIHFWYVLHHVPSREIRSFVNFIRRHLVDDGIVMFNTPYLDFDKGAYSDDGVNTTPYTLKEVVEYFGAHFFCLHIDGTKWGKSNGHIYIGRAK